MAEAAERGCVLGIDIGGTFTDVVLVGPTGALTLGKSPTTPDDPTEGLLRGVAEVLERAGTRPADITRVAHATTLATNAILERKGPPVAFITTRGFRSMLTLGRAARVEDQRFDLFFDVPEPPVPASHCFEVPERIGAGGVVIEAFDEGAARRVADQVAALSVAGVGICFLHSYANGAHEQRMAELVKARLPAATVVASSEVWPELREYERATTTLMSAYVGPLMQGYLADLTERLAAIGVSAPVHIMESSGGVMSAALAAQRAVYTIESGPAAGVMSALQIGRELGIDDLLSFDMGGTTAKAGVVRGGRAEVTRSFHVGGTGSFGGRREGTGLPIKVPAIDLAEVGAGGGSIAWVDRGGTLRVGPRSAGARPGPACYGLGGDQPTVTDANLVLGYLDPEYFAGGSMPLHPERGRAALERNVCEPLGIDVASAAHAIHQIANANMGSAVHVVTVQRGIDPRGFAMLALGGAGPAHAARVAERFGIDRVVVPFGSGVGSAIGLLATDITTERFRTFPMREEVIDFSTVRELFDSLGDACIADLGTDPSATRTLRSVDMRYQGQAHEISVSAPEGDIDKEWLAELTERFHTRYAEHFGSPLEARIELAGFRVRVIEPVPRCEVDPLATSSNPERAEHVRPAYFEEHGGHVATPVRNRAGLRPGDRIEGPAIVEEPQATLVVPPGWGAKVDPRGNLVLEHGSWEERT
jgi:N-methylhydantoinase A